jgi:inhibitor of the pro-sigma K processing machinery
MMLSPEIRSMVTVRTLAVNAVVGLVILFLSNAIGLGVEISILSLLVCAILGVPGAILVIILAQLDILFVLGPVLSVVELPLLIGL